MNNTSSEPPQDNFSPFAKKLIKMGYSDIDQMRRAGYESRRYDKSLIQVLEKITGIPLPPEMVRLYKKEQLFQLKIAYGREVIDMDLEPIPISEIAQLIKNLIPMDMCRYYKILPIRVNDNPPIAIIAMVNPDDILAQDDLKRILNAQEYNLKRIVITKEDYAQVIQKLEQEIKPIQPTAKKEINQEQNSDKQWEFDNFSEIMEEENDDFNSENIAHQPIIKLVNTILAKALENKASEIHIEPQKEDLRIRFRQDGILIERFDPLPKKLIPSVISRIKIMANLDITERQMPQNGMIRRKFAG
ncbi:MAG TPA: ATPase, T2SS/T4P/T4SS family, partial [Allocoleopsis sp.]